MTRDQAVVFGGVDTHKDIHVAAAVDPAGRLLGTESFGADAAGYTCLLKWLKSHQNVAAVGVEGTGSYGAGLARSLTAAGVAVLEVNRVNRHMRHGRDKTDTVDAEAAARAALSGEAAAVPKAADGPVEAIRMLSAARRSAVKARTQATNQVNGLLVTAGEHLKERLRGLRSADVMDSWVRLRPDTSSDVVEAAAKRALRALARRHQELSAKTRRARRRAAAPVRTRQPRFARRLRRRPRGRSCAAGHRRRQPRPDAQRDVLRCFVRRQPHRGLLGPNHQNSNECPVSRIWDRFFVSWLGGGGLAVVVVGSGHVDGLVGADLVVGSAVGVGLGGEFEAVVDVSAVEVFVFDGFEEPLDHSVGPRSPMSGAGMFDVAR